MSERVCERCGKPDRLVEIGFVECDECFYTPRSLEHAGWTRLDEQGQPIDAAEYDGADGPSRHYTAEEMRVFRPGPPRNEPLTGITVDAAPTDAEGEE